MTHPKNLIIIGGPTAAGKTDVAISLALSLSSEIISADSRQVYKELDIGVAKPSPAQLQSVRHHFINHVSIHDEYNAGIYAGEALTVINELFKKHHYIIICGGTGLYIKAVTEGFDPLPGKNTALRTILKQIYETEGITALQQRLQQTDPEAYNHTEIQNPQRLMRAIEIAESDNTLPPGTAIQPNRLEGINLVRIGISPEREELYERINTRVDRMISEGLETEARSLYPFKELNALQTVGYSEWFRHFEGGADKQETINLIKQHTRQYAKRQLTWFRNQENMAWFDASQTEDILQYISKTVSLHRT